MIGSRSRSSSTSETTVDTRNINFQDVEGLAVAGGDGVTTVNVTDQGAIEVAAGIAESGIGAFRENVTLTRDIIQAGAAQTESVTDLARGVLARESTNVDPRLEDITKAILVGAVIIVAVVIFGSKFRGR